jgi:hypothetical protein
MSHAKRGRVVPLNADTISQRARDCGVGDAIEFLDAYLDVDEGISPASIVNMVD